jgi:hypothetical protein
LACIVAEEAVMGIQRLVFFLVALVALSPGAAVAQTLFAQSRRVAEPTPACVAGCTDTCQKELVAVGCNPAVGLTSCRIRQDQCVSVCTRKCPPS